MRLLRRTHVAESRIRVHITVFYIFRNRLFQGNALVPLGVVFFHVAFPRRLKIDQMIKNGRILYLEIF